MPFPDVRWGSDRSRTDREIRIFALTRRNDQA